MMLGYTWESAESSAILPLCDMHTCRFLCFDCHTLLALIYDDNDSKTC